MEKALEAVETDTWASAASLDKVIKMDTSFCLIVTRKRKNCKGDIAFRKFFDAGFVDLIRAYCYNTRN
jgi:hypothetical protein